MHISYFELFFAIFQGEQLTTGIQASDCKMLIGDSSCVTLMVYSNVIICTAPDSKPDPHPEDSSSGEIGVRVGCLFYVRIRDEYMLAKYLDIQHNDKKHREGSMRATIHPRPLY